MIVLKILIYATICYENKFPPIIENFFEENKERFSLSFYLVFDLSSFSVNFPNVLSAWVELSFPLF